MNGICTKKKKEEEAETRRGDTQNREIGRGGAAGQTCGGGEDERLSLMLSPLLG